MSHPRLTTRELCERLHVWSTALIRMGFEPRLITFESDIVDTDRKTVGWGIVLITQGKVFRVFIGPTTEEESDFVDAWVAFLKSPPADIDAIWNEHMPRIKQTKLVEQLKARGIVIPNP